MCCLQTDPDPQNHVKHKEDVESHNQFEVFAVATILQLNGLRIQVSVIAIAEHVY